MRCNLQQNQLQDGLLAYYTVNKTCRALLHTIITASVQYGVKRTDLSVTHRKRALTFKLAPDTSWPAGSYKHVAAS